MLEVGAYQLPDTAVGLDHRITRDMPNDQTERGTAFGKPWMIGAIESLDCNRWKNMHQIDA